MSTPIQICLSNLKDPFTIVSSFLSQKSIISLSLVSREFNSFALEAAKSNRLNRRIKDLIATKFFTSNEVYNKFEESISDLDNRLTFRGPIVKLINRLESIRIEFIQSQLSGREKEIKLIASIKLVIEEYKQFSECKVNFYLLYEAISSTRPELIIKQIIKKYSKSISRLQLIEQQFVQKLVLLDYKKNKNLILFCSLRKVILKEYQIENVFKTRIAYFLGYFDNSGPQKSKVIERVHQVIKEYGEFSNCEIDLTLLQTAIKLKDLIAINSIIDKHYKSIQCDKDLNVLFILQSNLNAISGIKEIINKYGSEYLPLVEHILTTEPYIKIEETDVQQIIRSLMKTDFTEAINFINILVKKLKINSINLQDHTATIQSFKQKLYSMMLSVSDDYPISYCITLLKVISGEFDISAFLPKFFIRAIISNDYKSISDILEFIQIANLDPFSRNAVTIQAQVIKIKYSLLKRYDHYLIIRSKDAIDDIIQFMRMIPQKEIKTNILNGIVFDLLKEEKSVGYLSKKEIDKLKNDLRIREVIMSRRLEEIAFFLDLNSSIMEKRKKEFFGTQEITTKAINKKKDEILLKNKLEDDLYFDSLASFLIEFSFEKEEIYRVFDLLKEIAEIQKKSKYAKELIRHYIKRDEYYEAYRVAREIPGKEGKELYEKIRLFQSESKPGKWTISGLFQKAIF